MDTLDEKTLANALSDLEADEYGCRIFNGNFVRTVEGITFVYNNVCFPNVPDGVITEDGLKKMFERGDHVFDVQNGEKTLHVNSFFYDAGCDGKTLRGMTIALGYPETHKTHVQRHLSEIPHKRFGRLILWSTNSLQDFKDTTGF